MQRITNGANVLFFYPFACYWLLIFQYSVLLSKINTPEVIPGVTHEQELCEYS